MTYQTGFWLTVRAQINTPFMKLELPELKADAKTAWGCLTYLLAKG